MKIAKKGFIASTVVSFFSYVLFILVIILFFFIFSISRGEISAKITSKVENVDANTVLLNYLRTPIGIDNKNVADLIADFVDYSDETGKKYVDRKIVYPTSEDPFLNIVADEDVRAESLGIIITKLKEASIFHKDPLKEKIADCGAMKCYLALVVSYGGEEVIHYKPLDGTISLDVGTEIPSRGSEVIKVRIMEVTTGKSAYDALLAAQSSRAGKPTPTSKETLHYDWGAGLDWNEIMKSREYTWEDWNKDDLTYILDRLSDKDLMIIVDAYNKRGLVRDIDVDKIKDPKKDLRKWFSPIKHEPGHLPEGFEYGHDPKLFRALAKKYYKDWKEAQKNE